MTPEARVSLSYFAIAMLWIIFSDSALAALLRFDSDLLQTAQTYKGGLFVLVTSTLLYLLLRRGFQQRRDAEQSVRQSETSFRYLFVNNPIPMWIYDLQTLAFLDVNDTAIARYGYSREEFLSMRLTDIRPLEDVERLLTDIASARPSLQFSGDWRHRFKDGTVIDVEIISHEISFAGRRAALVVAHDITERRRAEAERLEREKLRLALNKEAELRRQRDRFVSMISHEFRAPLSVIAANNGMLERYYARMSDEMRADYFTRTQAEVERLADMLDDMLAILRAEAVGPQFNAAPLELVAFCSTLADEMRRMCNDSHRIVFETREEALEVHADASLLRHAISNLLSNAVKYSPTASVVTITLERQKDQVVIGVADQGIGIPEAARAQLFDAFFRAGNVRDIPGTGLGLAIARQAIDLHQGTITVESVEGAGSVFKVFLPAQSAEAGV